MAKKTTIITIVKKRTASLNNDRGRVRGVAQGNRYVSNVHYDLKYTYSNTRSMITNGNNDDDDFDGKGAKRQNRKKANKQNENIKIYMHRAHATSSYSAAIA